MKKILLTLSGCLALSTMGFAQLNEDFESVTAPGLPTGWSQTVASGAVASDSVGWNTGTSSTLSTTYFPMPSHTKFIAVNDDRKQFANNSASALISPSFSTVGMATPYLSFDCSFTHNILSPGGGGFWESAKIEISNDNGTTWQLIDTLGANTYWWETKYYNLSSYATTATNKLRFTYSDNTGWEYGWGIDNVKVFSANAIDMAITALTPVTGTPSSYGLAGSPITVKGSVFNNSSTPASGVTVSYVFNGGTPSVTSIPGTIAPFTSATFTATTPVTMPTAVGPYQLRALVYIPGDVNASNDTSGYDTLNTVAFMPTKRIAFEEGTGTWCGWCPRGAVYMDSLHTLYGEGVSLVAVHNTNPSYPNPDPMTVTVYNSWLAPQLGGFPNVMFDRSAVGDPSTALAYYTAHSADFAFADITAVPTVTGSSISIAVSVKPAINISNARLALVLTEDKLKGTTAGWNQYNYYSGSSTASLTGQGVNYNALPNPIPAASMTYNHVARTILPSVTGGTGLLPASMTYSTPYNYTFTTTLDPSWIKGNIHGVVLLIDGVTGAVLNSVNVRAAVGISDLSAGINNMIVAPNPTTSEAFIRVDLKNASKVQVEISDVTGRSVYSAPATDYAAGNNMINIPLNNFATGLYNVSVQTESGIVTTKLNVVK